MNNKKKAYRPISSPEIFSINARNLTFAYPRNFKFFTKSVKAEY